MGCLFGLQTFKLKRENGAFRAHHPSNMLSSALLKQFQTKGFAFKAIPRSSPVARNFSKGTLPLRKQASFPEKFAENVKATEQALAGKDSRDIYQKEYYHWSHLALTGLIPTAFILSPSALNLPIDYALAVAIPAHTYMGCTIIIDDYIHGSVNTIAKAVLIVLVILTAAGLLMLNAHGIGLTESAKQLWRKEDVSKRL
ncbi:succinate dehydrogenase [Planoprotostelium fungivorum]|uniref:Succinate dehydrogenase [ubiquinone] cytochrome b small subunit n=1 Tax=Planoprotostelium fungivorum TaxID=1890364 RepID=A0A2P6NUB3_9EUKA|nr:succinate dehydrogenase [Planoprotostelium fungivorum]